MLHFFARHHNKIQFFGYEVANVIWVLDHATRTGQTGYGANVETAAALAFLIGSGLIWRFEPERRPHMLFYGGVMLALGGVGLVMAGFALTGLAVVLASLETARGGMAIVSAHVDRTLSDASVTRPSHQFTFRLAYYVLGWYQRPVAILARRFPGLGRYIDERPFVTGALIKAPLRLEFIIKKLLIADWVGVAVGLSWMLLGDVALAFNDVELQELATRRSASPMVGAIQRNV
ncbi:MAG: hypothetical protein R3A44_08700 [Caldilineaceae bacterium]